MFLRGLGTAHPARRYTKAECREAFQTSPWFAARRARAQIAETVLQRDNGIERAAPRARLARGSLRDRSRHAARALRRRMRRRSRAEAAARALPTRASKPRADRRGRGQHLHGLPLPGPDAATCIERLGLARGRAGVRSRRPGLRRGAAELAHRRRAARGRAVRATCCRCASRSAARRCISTTTPACWSARACSATAPGRRCCRATPPAANARSSGKASARCSNPAEREALRFEQRGGMLRNILTRPVPRLAAEHAGGCSTTCSGAPASTARTSPRGSGTPAAATCCRRSQPARSAEEQTCATARRCCASTAT